MTNILYLIPFILILVLWVKDDINRALYAVVITELTMASSDLFFGVSPRNLFVPYAILLGIIKYFKGPSYRIKLPTLNSVIFLTVFVYYLWAFFVQVLIHGYSIFDYRFHILLGKSFWFISTAFLIQYFITDEQKLKRFINVVIIFCGISAVVGIFQVFLGSIFVDLRNILRKITPLLVMKKPLATGFKLLNFPFACDMLMGAFLSFPIWMNIKSKKKYIKNWLLFLIIFGGLIFSLTKSAIAAFLIGILMLAILLKKRLMILFLIIAPLSILLISNINYLERNTAIARIMNISGYKRGLSVRKPFSIIGLKIIWNEPFGIGNERYEEYVKKNSNKFENISGWENATKSGPHNHFLLNTVYFGWIAGFISLLFIIELFITCRRIYVSASSEFEKVLAIVIAAFFAAYSFNIFFHNAGFFKGDASVWIVTGILLSLNNIRDRKQKIEIA